MNTSGLKRWVVTLVMVTTVIGVLSGSVVGGLAGYWVASRKGETEPVVLVQLGSGSIAEQAPVEDPESNDGPVVGDEAPESLDGQDPAETEEPVAEPPAVEAPAVEEQGSAEPVVLAVERVQPATVLVVAERGTGSGAIISQEGYVVTNNHVVEGSNQFMVVYDRGERVNARLVGTAPHFDLAVLQVEGPIPAVAEWGESSAVPLGGQVIAIGSALGSYQNSVTTGILSGVNRELGGLVGLLQHDAAINRGNSGGPLVNREGQIIGINTMMLRGGQAEAEGLGFAIPSAIARTVVQELIENGEAPRPVMGVNLLPVNSQVADEYGLNVSEGALIQEVVPGGAAAEAGIRAGDVVVAVNGEPVNARDTLQMRVLSHAAGDTVNVSIIRDGLPMEVAVTLRRAA